MELSYILITVTSLFFVLLIFKGLLRGTKKEKFCVICACVILSWIILLVLYWKGLFNDSTILGILMGTSILGIFYFLESRVKKEFHLFKLPFLLTLITLAYLLINLNFSSIINSVLFLSILWVIFFIFYSFKNSDGMGKLVNKIIGCCKRM